MTRAEVIAALGRMNDDEKAFLKQLPSKEAVVFLEFFHFFPGCRMEVPLTTPKVFDDDALETQTRSEVWEAQDAKHDPYDIPY